MSLAETTVAQEERQGDELYDFERPRGEVVFALARGVASVVAISAVVLLAVIVIIAKTIVMMAAEKVGVGVMFGIIIGAAGFIGTQLGFPARVMVRVLVRCCV